MAEVLPDTLPELPVELVLGDIAGLPVKATPGLEHEGRVVRLRLYRDFPTALASTRVAFPVLCAEALGRDLGWLQRDLVKELKRVALGYAFLMDADTLARQSYDLIRRHLLECANPLPLSPATLEAVLTRARERLKGLVPVLVDQLASILAKRDEVMALAGKETGWQPEVDALVNRRFLSVVELSQLKDYTRYLEALKIRIQRARQNPVRDAEKAQPLLALIRRYQALNASAAEKRRLRWLLEEFKVQVFAQELGTARKVSLKILNEAFESLETQAGRRA